jgi:hypothetical protein
METEAKTPKLSELIERDAPLFTLKTEYQGKETDADKWTHYAWRVTITRLSQTKKPAYSMTIPYRMGTAHSTPTKPSPLDRVNGDTPEPTPTPPDIKTILWNLISDAATLEYVDSFEEWARELGYDPDSRKAEKIYHACEEETRKTRRLLGDLYQEYLDAENDI